MKRKFVVAMLTVLSVVSICMVNPYKTYAINSDNENKTNMKFEEFIEDCYSNMDMVSIVDTNGQDVKDKFTRDTMTLYLNKNFKGIKDVIYGKNYNISLMEENISLYATNAKTVTVRVYHIKSDLTNHFKKEWFTYITSAFTYDQNTYNINSVKTPSVTIDANFGLNFSVSTSNISTSAKINNDRRSVTLYAQYNLSATLTISWPLGKKYNWGTIYASGYADPWS